MSRPIVYVTGPDKGGWPAWRFTAHAVRRAGGKPVRVTPKRAAKKALPPPDAVVIGGGTDVSPDLYGAVRQTNEDDRPGRFVFLDRAVGWLVLLLRILFGLKAKAQDPERDELETRVLRGAKDRGIPILGICRGMQLLNVVHGGNLSQDVRHFYVETAKVRSVFPRKPVDIVPDSHLASALGTTNTRVNALHDQAVDALGDGLIAVAREPAGIVQAIEHPDARFVIGVQWHPEYLPQLEPQRRLFAALIAATREPAAAEAREATTVGG